MESEKTEPPEKIVETLDDIAEALDSISETVERMYRLQFIVLVIGLAIAAIVLLFSPSIFQI